MLSLQILRVMRAITRAIWAIMIFSLVSFIRVIRRSMVIGAVRKGRCPTGAQGSPSELNF